MLKRSVLVGILSTVVWLVVAQSVTDKSFETPLKIPFEITSNFGELRAGHFHAGIDLRAPMNTPIYAPSDGYVSRISIAAGGYGYALYIAHPTGETTVYAHANTFIPKIEEVILRYQNNLKYFAFNAYLKSYEIPITKGELIGYTGNRGSSGGPHLHFEIRETATQKPINPLTYYKDKLTDTRPPIIKRIEVLPHNGVVNGEDKKIEYQVETQKGGHKTVKNSTPITAWGEILLGVGSYDYVDNMSNIYGVQTVELYKDNELIYKSHIDTLDFSKGIMINTFVDYETWQLTKHPIMVSYIADGNTLDMYSNVIDRGVININEERDYIFKYRVTDIYDNADSVIFAINGAKTPLAAPKQHTATYNKAYNITKDNFKLSIPKYASFTSWTPEYVQIDTVSSTLYSNIHMVNPQYTPMAKYSSVAIKVNSDTIANKSQYCIESYKFVDGELESDATLLGEYKDGWVYAKSRKTGAFAVVKDSLPPTIELLGVSNGELKLKVVDEVSGLKYFRGEINDEFVIFTIDIKDKIARYRIDKSKFPVGVTHKLKFEAKDNCKNISYYIGDVIF